MFAIAEDGAKIWYESVPGPRPVLLVHGFASDSRRNWTDTGWLRALAEHGYVTVDLRGHGQSGKPSSGYTPEDMARDLLAVLDVVSLSTVDVVTYSMGGIIAWQLARIAPDRVRRMVLGGIGTRPAAREDMLRVQERLSGEDLSACIDGMAGSRIEGSAPVPVLFAAGDADEFAADAPEPFVSLGSRNHFNAVSSRAFKQAALEFFGS
ncbi:alpha/beta hydrolase [Amycolatopsis acidiphila]|uniref:Alpha/beta hydrolase n=1 Tax=Amycolatopsis acidiphila TaxID=715473 RepID=A0A558A826_9PSEU|nr:alpha/beta hydrolase [Amycolatopsis acidiphila]TVT20406.1 alpha/beta hydrolase [Amycolatopsis acidiphila]UIJ59204.1 alpha/beta hydrolase [Amycolatopsis acidiphila]GHG79111.1 alpha/beta hydrolase [Amycolatopsis acidiphila]